MRGVVVLGWPLKAAGGTPLLSPYVYLWWGPSLYKREEEDSTQKNVIITQPRGPQDVV